jgi:hypothetical protein
MSKENNIMKYTTFCGGKNKDYATCLKNCGKSID